MITMDWLKSISQRHLLGKASPHEAAKRTELLRNMTRSWLWTPREVKPGSCSRTAGFNGLSGLIAELEQSLKTDTL